DEADWFCGDQWDHVALDPDHRLVLEVVVGKLLGGNAVSLLEGERDRLGRRGPELVTSDEYAAYHEALLAVFRREEGPARTGPPRRLSEPYAESHSVEAHMMYDTENLYLGGHVRDPYAMRNRLAVRRMRNPVDVYEGGSVQVHLSKRQKTFPFPGSPADAY